MELDLRGQLEQLCETMEFNARHMIAEDSLQDAWMMLDAAREQMAMDAKALRIIIANLPGAVVSRLTASPDTGYGRGWQGISTAPKDGTAFTGIEPPNASAEMRWEVYDPDVAAEIGEVGYWSYTIGLLADAFDAPQPTHWQPLPEPPVALSPTLPSEETDK